jgi:hypothetical protein
LKIYNTHFSCTYDYDLLKNFVVTFIRPVRKIGSLE